MGAQLEIFAKKVPGFLYPHRYLLSIRDQPGAQSDNNEFSLRSNDISIFYDLPDYLHPTIFNADNMLSLICTTAALPRDTVKTTQLTWCGENVTWPLKMQSGQTWSCVLTENQYGEIIKEVEEYLLHPMRICTITVIPVNDENACVWGTGIQMEYAFLSGCTPTDLRSDSIQVFEWTLTFNYAYTRRIS
jgi:hypothetical protein